MNIQRNILTLSLIASLMIAPFALSAQAPEDKKAAMKALRQEARTYVQDNIHPVLKAQREKLDLVLSQAEQNELADIRQQLEDLREEKKALRPKHAQRSQSHEPPTQEQKDAMRAFHKQQRLLMDRAWKIADAHETTIYKLLDEVEPQRQQWHADLKKMHEDARGQFQGQRGEGRSQHRQGPPQGHPGKGHEMRHGHGSGHGHGLKGRGMSLLKHLQQPVGFLLWNGEMPERKKGKLGETEEMPFQNEDQGFQVFPNPTGTANNLRYTLETPGTVTIKLLNKDGAVVKTLLQENQSEGSHIKTFDLGNLQAGVYYYQVVTAEGKYVKRFLVE